MKKSKKIGEIYREKLRDVETTPPEDVWENISASLPEKRRKSRLLPLWYKIAGTAAALVLLFSLYDNYFEDSTSSGTSVVTVPRQNKTYNFDPTSTVFEETMYRTSVLLEALMLDTRRNRFEVNQKTNVAESRRISEPVQEISVKPIISYTSIMDESLSSLSEFSTVPAAKIRIPADDDRADDWGESIAENEFIEEPIEKETLSKRFSVTTTAAAVYFDNLGKGNALDPNFSRNQSQGEISMAYGVNLGYQLSEKVRIRTGVSKVELSNNTKNINYTSAVSSGVINSEVVSLASPATGSLHQSLGFIEVPMEIEYALLKKKIGLSLIGGASTLFLNENMLSLNSPISTTNLGEANNLNDVSFSTNIGVGLNYKISPQFLIQLEPIFKYQLNTFSGNPGVNTYYFGIYSGLNYKF